LAGVFAVTLTLAIDTSTSRTIVGIIDEEKVIFEKFHDGATDHGRALSQLVAEALKVSSLPKQVVVGMGPGPFTGLRVGISFAHTFALARNIPVIGICSLDAIAIDESEYTVAIDARRKEIYWARYKDGIRIEGPSVSKPAEVEGFIIDKYPDMKKIVSLSTTQNITEPMYLRRPDAVPTSERS
jgi:tRNA threonylcarbamoyl adenosine modification protein YeaZ